MSKMKGKRSRWILRLEPYNFIVIHQFGQKHNNADALSWLFKEEDSLYMEYTPIDRLTFLLKEFDTMDNIVPENDCTKCKLDLSL